MMKRQRIVAALGWDAQDATRRVDRVRVESAGGRVLEASAAEAHLSTLRITQVFFYTFSITFVVVVVVAYTTLVRFR